ncbi:MAG: acyl-CoA thioesterase [Candidatus Gastranaerophilales bacterium]|nr:acyl-CoA thioesterase [Candidatus Gastranaerophilales bacterium]
MSLFQSEYEVKVSFEDLDPMNVVWHGNYVRYMEQARCDMLEKLKYNYRDMQKDGLMYPVAKIKIKYLKPATLGDILTVKTEIISVEPSLNIDYKIYNRITNEKIMSASTMQIAVRKETNESLYEISENFKKALIEAGCEKI